MTTDLPPRRWRARGAVPLETMTGPLAVQSDWMTEANARNTMWLYRQNVKSLAWKFWMEPEGMTDTEFRRYVPSDYWGSMPREEI